MRLACGKTRIGTSLPPMWPGVEWFGIDTIIMWVEFVAGFFLCFERFYSGFSSVLRNQLSKLKFDLGIVSR